MSDNTELLAAIKAMQAAQQQQPQGAITFGGINKYWPQIMGIAALIWFLMGQAREQEKLINRVTSVETAVQSINQVKADQLKSTSDMQVLQIDMTAVKQAQKEQATKMDTVLNAISTLGQQVQALSQAVRRN